MTCPICKGDIEHISTGHKADDYYECQVCSSTWSEGKLPEKDN